MPEFKTYGLIGLGYIGTPIAREILAQNLDLRILTRDAGKPEFAPYRNLGARIVSVDYGSPDAIKEALTGIDVLISTINYYALDAQYGLLQPAKDAGVKLFVPSEFANDTTRDDVLSEAVSVIKQKAEVRNKLEEIGLPWVGLVNGLFSGFLFSAFCGWNFKENKVIVAGDGNAIISAIHEDDVARFLVKALSQITLAEIGKGRMLYTKGFDTTPNETIRHAEEKLGFKFEISYNDAEGYRAACKEPKQTSYVPWTQWQFALGNFHVPRDDNSDFGFQPQYTLADIEPKAL